MLLKIVKVVWNKDVVYLSLKPRPYRRISVDFTAYEKSSLSEADSPVIIVNSNECYLMSECAKKGKMSNFSTPTGSISLIWFLQKHNVFIYLTSLCMFLEKLFSDETVVSILICTAGSE